MDLIGRLQERTTADVAAYLDQWTRNNALIDLSIGGVEIAAEPIGWTSTVVINLEADQDYELFTAIGLLEADGSLETKPIRITGSGSHSFVVTSSERPVSIVLDPHCRVPQTNIDNDEWS